MACKSFGHLNSMHKYLFVRIQLTDVIANLAAVRTMAQDKIQHLTDELTAVKEVLNGVKGSGRCAKGEGKGDGKGQGSVEKDSETL